MECLDGDENMHLKKKETSFIMEKKKKRRKEKKTLHVPSSNVFSLSLSLRKIGGTFLLATRLRARVPLRAMFAAFS